MSDKTIKINNQENPEKVTKKANAGTVRKPVSINPQTTVKATAKTAATGTSVRRSAGKTAAPMIKDYKITGVIGEGGMGKVYKAVHPTLKQEIILKELKIRDKDTRERFLREAKVMLNFRHENIVQVYDHFKEGVSTYIAMEYVKGMSLSETIHRNKKLPPIMALFIFYQAALGLNHAHVKKVVHRDVKPQNILISENGEVKIIDFGIATQKGNNAEASLTSPGSVIGTPAYMSPEQFSSSKEITYQSDIYSLGVVLYEMLTGIVPFKNEYSSEVLGAIAHGRFVPAGKFVKNLPDICRKILYRTFNPDIRKRYKTLVPVINLLKKYFKKYNIYELKASVKCLLRQEKDLRKFPYYAKDLELGKKNRCQMKVAIFFLFFCFAAAAFFCTNRHYEWILRNSYGKMNLTFNCLEGMDPDSLFLRVDRLPSQKVSFKIKESKTKKSKNKEVKVEKLMFKKTMYLPKGTHRISISSGSYKTVETVDILPVSMQKRNTQLVSGKEVRIDISNLDRKDVMVDFKFWDDFSNIKEPVFQFNNYRTVNDRLRQEEDNLYIWNGKYNMRLKDYVIRSLDPPKSYPFYSDREYAFVVSGFEKNGIQYLNRRFKLNFGLDDRTVTVHIPLIPQPALIQVSTKEKSVKLKVNGKYSGWQFAESKDENGYIIASYSNVKERTIKGWNTFDYYLLPGKCSIQFGNGRIIKESLKSGQKISFKVEKEKGKFVY